MCRLCCLGGGLAVVRRRGGRRLIALASRIGIANRRLRVLGRSELTVVEEDEAEEGEVEEDSGMRTEVTAQGATRQVAALLGDAGARVTIVGVRAEARRRGGESAITVLREVVAAVDGGAAQATRMPATGAIAVIAAVAVAGTVADVGGRAKEINTKEMKARNGNSNDFSGASLLSLVEMYDHIRCSQ